MKKFEKLLNFFHKNKSFPQKNLEYSKNSQKLFKKEFLIPTIKSRVIGFVVNLPYMGEKGGGHFMFNFLLFVSNFVVVGAFISYLKHIGLFRRTPCGLFSIFFIYKLIFISLLVLEAIACATIVLKLKKNNNKMVKILTKTIIF